MTIANSLEQFLCKNNIDYETWQKAEIDSSILQSIAEDHEKQLAQLEESATLFARLIQKYPHVHSVRWRVKSSDHLLEKIIRKLAEKNEKYQGINVQNYFETVTDLVGIRVLHLFKEDCFDIDHNLTQQWSPIETPVAYIRTGDRDELIEQFKAHSFEIKEHPAGYRSVHYVFSSQPMKRKVITEVQVRTIFEEGWSEIDHTVRYPNFSDNELVEYFLTIFNRLAGSADEMGAFVRRLAGNLSLLASQITEARNENAGILRDMETTLGELEAIKAQDKNSRDHIEKLKAELEKLKTADANKSTHSAPTGANFDFPAFLRRNGINTIPKEMDPINPNKSPREIEKLLIEFHKSKNRLSYSGMDALAAAAKGIDLSKFETPNSELSPNSSTKKKPPPEEKK